MDNLRNKGYKSRREKIDYLKAIQAGTITIKPAENPLKDIDLDNLPCGSNEDLIKVWECYNYACEFSHKQAEIDKLFEGKIRAGIACGLVDEQTERIWRNREKANHKNK